MMTYGVGRRHYITQGTRAWLRGGCCPPWHCKEDSRMAKCASFVVHL